MQVEYIRGVENSDVPAVAGPRAAGYLLLQSSCLIPNFGNHSGLPKAELLACSATFCDQRLMVAAELYGSNEKGGTKVAASVPAAASTQLDPV